MYSRAIGLACLLAILVNCVTAPNPPPNVCETDVCKRESANFRSQMDEQIDPCENFYDFACGTFIKTAKIAKDKPLNISMFQMMDKLKEQVNLSLLEKSQPNELHAFKLAKDFLNTCMDTETLNAAGIEPMVKFLDKYGGWPVTKGANEWNENDWDWLKVKQKTYGDGFLGDLILAFQISPDEKNSSKQGIFVSKSNLN